MSGRFSSGSALSAVAVALIVFAASIVLRLLSTIVSAIMFGAQSTGLYDLTPLSPMYWWGFLVGPLPFVIGVFLSLWLALPIAAKQSIARVIGTSLLAVAAGAVVIFAVALAGSLLGNFDESAGRVYGWVSGLFSSVSTNADWVVVQALYSAVSLAISLIPLTVLAGVLVWIRLRERSAESVTAGPAAEV